MVNGILSEHQTKQVIEGVAKSIKIWPLESDGPLECSPCGISFL